MEPKNHPIEILKIIWTNLPFLGFNMLIFQGVYCIETFSYQAGPYDRYKWSQKSPWMAQNKWVDAGYNSPYIKCCFWFL